jgi:CRP-like cAMP-binding protein
MRDDTPLMTKRILELRQFAMFERADLAELAVLAENVVERTFEATDLVAGVDRLESLNLVMHGELGYGATQIRPRQVHGALEVAAGRSARMPTIARSRTRTLELAASDYLEILEDNFGLLHAVIRDLAARVLLLGIEPRPHATIPSGTFGFVERMIVLRQLLPFVAGRLEPLAILAHAAVERRWPSGTLVRSDHDATLVVLEGSLRCGNKVIGVGHAVGALEVLAGVPNVATLEAITPIRALEIPAAAILDVLEDHTDFALAIMQALARAVVDDESRKAGAGDAPGANPAQPAAVSLAREWRTS